jgi:hypothetical protein
MVFGNGRHLVKIAGRRMVLLCGDATGGHQQVSFSPHHERLDLGNPLCRYHDQSLESIQGDFLNWKDGKLE